MGVSQLNNLFSSSPTPTQPKQQQVSKTEAMSDKEETPVKIFTFNGVVYQTYQEMVDAKRKRNLEALRSSGLLDAKAAIHSSVMDQKRAAATARGLKRSKEEAPATNLPRRKSSRLAGESASGIYVESELGNGRVSIAGGTIEYEEPEPAFFKNRVNDGSDLSISEAVELTGSKWTKEGTVASAEQFMTRTLSDIVNRTAVTTSRRKPQGSPTSVVNAISTTITSNNLQSHLDALSLDDAETCVAKVTPERIYSVTCHPSPHHIIACAGDKKGHVGIWNVDQYNPNVSANTTAEEGRENAMKSTNDGVHLFKPHSGAVSSMIWNASGTTLLSASYDGSVRAFDASKQVFEEIFATYDDDEQYKNRIGYNLDNGYKSWVQCMVGKELGCFILWYSHCITSLTNFTSLSYL